MPRPRHERRAREREVEKLVGKRVRLFEHQEGSSPARPFLVESVGIVEVVARSVRCPRCDTSLSVEDHRALVRDGVRLRELPVRCSACQFTASLWFRLLRALEN